MRGETEVFVDDLVSFLEELGSGGSSEVELLTVEGKYLLVNER